MKSTSHRYAEILTAHPTLSNREALVQLHAERMARRPLTPSDATMPRTVPIPPRRKKPEFSSRR